MTDVHPDDEALSAHLDGEEPQVGTHAQGCPPCARRLEELGRVRAVIAAPVPAPRTSQREAAIARALRDAGRIDREPWHRRFATRAAGVAAALLLLVGAAYAFVQLTESDREETLSTAGGSVSADQDTEASLPSVDPDAVGDLGDLGTLDGSAALRSRIQPRAEEFAVARGAPTQRMTESQASADEKAGDESAKRAALGCAAATRGLDPKNVGPTYAGTATWQGTPANVLVYSVQGQPGAVHVYVAAQTDCRLLEFQSYAP